ncbi:hypothetical protein Golob_004372 [Gossypium lobatum]|uniref:Uncharacterized protein n=1 Tax=Gossypium lobatum TaxID=34289 RepID=A0A7J8N1R1_9ROSI|nr:hypothetical protein [Gossypium lobatum]
MLVTADHSMKEMKQTTLGSFHPYLFYKGSNPSTCTLTDSNNPLLPPPPLPESSQFPYLF